MFIQLSLHNAGLVFEMLLQIARFRKFSGFWFCRFPATSGAGDISMIISLFYKKPYILFLFCVIIHNGSVALTW